MVRTKHGKGSYRSHAFSTSYRRVLRSSGPRRRKKRCPCSCHGREPTVSLPGRLPEELRVMILQYAVGEPHDYDRKTTMMSLMLVCRAAWTYVAPLFWEGAAGLILSLLDPAKLTRFRVSGSASSFGSTLDNFVDKLEAFTRLTHLRLKGCEAVPSFRLIDLSLPDLPLQSLHLDLAEHNESVDSIFRYLCLYAPTLEHLSLFLRITPSSPPPHAHLSLPNLRHLRLGIPNPHLVLVFLLRGSPLLEVLDLPSPSHPNVALSPGPVDYTPFFRLLPSLAIFSAPQSLVDVLPPTPGQGGLDPLVGELKKRGVLVLWREKGSAKWAEMDELDRWTREWKVGGEKAAFLTKQGYLDERKLTAEYA
ncbi:hypothetical protein JCM8097_003006 [Rhodosporidiobolus ruineniae]